MTPLEEHHSKGADANVQESLSDAPEYASLALHKPRSGPAMLRDRQIRLTRIDAFPDPFEGSVPKKQIDDQVAIFWGCSAH